MSMVNTMPLSADVHPHPQIRIGFNGLANNVQYFTLLTYKLLLTHYITNNLYDIPYRPHSPGNDMAYSWCPYVIWPAIPERGHRYGSLHFLDDAAVVEYV